MIHRRLLGWSGFCVLLLCLVLAAGVRHCAAAVPQGEWVQSGDPVIDSIQLAGARLVLTANGRPLLFSSIVQEYHVDTGEWTLHGAQRSERIDATVTVLPSGLMLVAGGLVGDRGLSTAELHDPATGMSTPTGDMHLGRSGHQATLLASGQVLVAGGFDGNRQRVAGAEIYDPATGTWTVTGALNVPRAAHAAVRLRSGRVLVAGGAPDGPAVGEIYDPTTGVWTATSPMARARAQTLGTQLLDGRALFAALSGPGGETLESEIYDEATSTWAPPVPVPIPFATQRFLGGLVTLHDGTPLLTSCSVGRLGCASNAGALFDVQANGWTLTPLHGTTGDMVVLPDGRVLSVANSSFRIPAELFRPDNTTPRLVVTGDLDFGEVRPGAVVQRALTIQNMGGATLIGTVRSQPPVVSSLSVLSGASFTLPPEGTSTVVVSFSAPASFEAPFGVLEFRSNGNWLRPALSVRVGIDLSGRIADGAGRGFAGLVVDFRAVTSTDVRATGHTVTDLDGRYRFLVPPNTSVTVTPTSVAALTLAPGTRSVAVSTADVRGVDFTASLADDVAAFVAGLYDTVLGRPLDVPGLDAASRNLRGHCDPRGFEGVVSSFFDSDEFRASRRFTLAQLVTMLYRGLLARDPDPVGAAGFVDVFRADRRELAIVFAASGEFRSLLQDRGDRGAVTAVVTRFYTQLLGRPPDPVGLSGWVDTIVATGNVEGVAAAFVTSPEFETHALTFAEFVAVLYRSVLGRDPDPAGLEAFDSRLRSTLRAVFDAFIASAEFRQRIPAVCGS